MRVKELKHMIDSLPDPARYDNDYVSVEYYPAMSVIPTKGEEWSKPIKTMTLVFQRVYTYYGHDWELKDVNILIK